MHSRTVQDRRADREGLVLLAKGGGFLVGGGIAEFAFRMGIAWILARALGASGYGIYTLVVGVSALTAAIGGLGLDDAMVRYLAIQTRRKDGAGIRGTLQVGVVGALVVGTVAGVGLFLLASWVAVGVFDKPEMVPLIQVISGVIPFLLLSNVLLGVTRGFNRMDYAAFAENVVQSGVRLVLLAILWFIDLNVLTAVIAFGVADVASSLVFIALTRKLMRTVGPPVPPRREYGAIFGFALPLWLSGLLNRFRGRIGTFVLGILAIAADVGIFAVAARVNLLSHVTYRAVVVAVKPVLAQSFADGDRERLARTYSATTRWTFSIALPLFLGSVLYSRQILGIFGPEFVAGSTVFILLAAGELVIAATGTCGSMIDMAGHTRVKVFNSVLWTVLAVGLSVLLIPPLGVIGAALGAMASQGIINLVRVLEVWILDRLQPWRADFWKPITAAAVAALWALGLKLVFGEPSFVIAGIQGVSMVGIYAGVLVMLGMHEDDRVIIGRIGRKLARLVGRG